MAGPQVSRQKVEAAVAGDSMALREVLTQIVQTTEQQQNVTGTVAKHNTTAGQANPAAEIPAQATGTVSVLNSNYVVQLVNPGGTSPVSQLQAQQQAGSANLLTSLQPVRPIYHQIRASTSPAFNVNSNTQTFGGDTGQVQTYWTLTGLGSGTWYFQFRSSYDGVNWNKWRNANGGTALGGLVNQVTVETQGTARWAVFTLPGNLVFGIGAAVLHDQGIFNLASEVFSSGMLAIAGPNGYDQNGNGVCGINQCDVDIQTPTVPAAGIPDYPVEILMRYASSISSYTSPGTANVFAFAFNPTNDAVKLYPGTGATWAVLRLPGGAKIAIGQGKNNDGETIWTPPLSWFDSSRVMGLAVPTGQAVNGSVITGIQASLSGLTLNAKYQKPDGSLESAEANWIAIAWQSGAPVQTVGSGKFLTIGLQGGHEMLIGCGSTASGTNITVPAGFSTANSLSIAVPAGCDAVAHNLRGVQECALFGTSAQLIYSDNSNTWGGTVGWMMALWK